MRTITALIGTVILLGVLFSACDSPSQKTEGYDFRQIRWGMCKANVIASEGYEPTDRADYWIWYKGITAADLSCHLGYFIVNDTLTMARYAFTGIDLQADQYVRKYLEIKSLLSSKYGSPVSDTAIWFKKEQRPVSMGEWIERAWNADSDTTFDLTQSEGSSRTEWLLPRTSISLYLRNDSTGIHFGIDYTGREFARLAQKGFQDRVLKDL